MPGRSISWALRPASSRLACIKSTVMPGQLPIWAWLPVSLLNRVDLPVLGMPSTAIVAGRQAVELLMR